MKKILILGIDGMLGHKMFQILRKDKRYDVYGSARSIYLTNKVIKIKDVNDIFELIKVLNPDIVINCIGIIKQKDADRETMMQINALFPQELGKLCDLFNKKVIQISTDCVFDGKKGGYTEVDEPNATDDYAVSKRMGELDRHLTIRTSLIGHELRNKLSLLDWFLGQNEVNGYKNAIFSGLTTVEFSRMIRDYVLPNIDRLSGIYNVSSSPISKYDLLSRINKVYGSNIKINKDRKLSINRSLNSSKFKNETGYNCPIWAKMINDMYKDYIENVFLYKIIK
jgi:dTDP-4-dehydrorhamnose reductase